MAKRETSWVDVQVGKRMRNLRKSLGLKQRQIAAKLDMSFQQVQKYESGQNRVSAATLLRFAQSLDVPLDYFFEGIESLSSDGAKKGQERQAFAEMRTFVESPEGRDLIGAYLAIKSPDIRKRCVALIRSLAKTDL